MNKHELLSSTPLDSDVSSSPKSLELSDMDPRLTPWTMIPFEFCDLERTRQYVPEVQNHDCTFLVQD